MGLKRSLVSIAISSAFAATALAAPAEANQASGNAYAASVATTTSPSVNSNTTKYTFGSAIRSTSPTVPYVHGYVKLRVIRASDSVQVFTATKTVDGKSGKGYWVTVAKSKFTKGVNYKLVAEFHAKAGHLEKSSSEFRSFKR
jgi:hypothetical protein